MGEVFIIEQHRVSLQVNLMSWSFAIEIQKWKKTADEEKSSNKKMPLKEKLVVGRCKGSKVVKTIIKAC